MMLTIFSKYWKHIAIVTVSILFIVGVYFKGYNDCAKKYLIMDQKETIKRINKWQKEERRIDEIDNKIDNSRTIKPIDDARDSCILSNDPYNKKCVE